MGKINTQLLLEAGFSFASPLNIYRVSLDKTVNLDDLNADFVSELEGFEPSSDYKATLSIGESGDIDLYVFGKINFHVEWGIDPNSTRGQRLLVDAGVLVSKEFGEGHLVDWVDRVDWVDWVDWVDCVDPDGDVLSGPWVIKAVESESGVVENSDTLVFIANEAGSECQAFASEIIQHFEPEDQSAMLVIRPDGRVVRADKNGSYAVYEKGGR